MYTLNVQVPEVADLNRILTPSLIEEKLLPIYDIADIDKLTTPVIVNNATEAYTVTIKYSDAYHSSMLMAAYNDITLAGQVSVLLTPEQFTDNLTLELIAPSETNDQLVAAWSIDKEAITDLVKAGNVEVVAAATEEVI